MTIAKIADVEDAQSGTVLAPPKKLKGLACITGTALEDLISPANLNGGALEDIYKVHQEDFDEPQTLEVAYSDGRGGIMREIVFVDPVHSEQQPRIFASIAGIQAMHNAISVLSRKVDSLVSTLQQSRAAYFKELLALRSQLGLQRHAMEENADAEFSAADVTFFHDLDRQRRIEEITEAIDQKVHRATIEIEEQLGWTREEVKRLQTKLTIAEREKLRAGHEGVFYEDHKLVLEELLKNKDAKELLRCLKDLSIEDQNEDRFFGSMMDLVGEHKGLDLRSIEREIAKERERRQSMEVQLSKADSERRALSTEKKQLRYELEELKLEQLRRGSGESHKSVLEGLARVVGLPVLLQSLEEVVPQASSDAFYSTLAEMVRRYEAVDPKAVREDLSYRQLLARLAEGGAAPKELILALQDIIEFPRAGGFLQTLVELLAQLTGVNQRGLHQELETVAAAARDHEAVTGPERMQPVEGTSNAGTSGDDAPAALLSGSRSKEPAGSRGQKQALERLALEKGQSRELLLALRDVASFTGSEELLQALKEVIEQLTGADLLQEEGEEEEAEASRVAAAAAGGGGGGGESPVLPEEAIPSGAAGAEEQEDGHAPDSPAEGEAEGAKVSRTEAHEAPEVPAAEAGAAGAEGRSSAGSEADSDESGQELQEEPSSCLYRQVLEDLLEKGAPAEELLVILKDLAKKAKDDGFVDAVVTVLGELTGIDVRDLEKDLSNERASRKDAEEKYVVLKRQSFQAPHLQPPRLRSSSYSTEDLDRANGPSAAPAQAMEGEEEAEAREATGSGFGRRRLVQSTSQSRRSSQEEGEGPPAALGAEEQQHAELLEKGLQAQELLRALKARATLTEADEQLVSSVTQAVEELVQAAAEGSASGGQRRSRGGDAGSIGAAHRASQGTNGSSCAQPGSPESGGSSERRGSSGRRGSTGSPGAPEGADGGSCAQPGSPESSGSSERRGSSGRRGSTGSPGAPEEVASAGDGHGGEAVAAAPGEAASAGDGHGGEAVASAPGEEPAHQQKRLHHILDMESTALPGFTQASLLAELVARAGEAKGLVRELKDSGLLLNTLIEILEDLTGIDRHSLQQELAEGPAAAEEERAPGTLQTELGAEEVVKHLERVLAEEEAVPPEPQQVEPATCEEELAVASAAAVEPTATLELRVNLREAQEEVQRRRQDLGHLLALLRHLVDPAAAEGAAQRLLNAAASGWQPAWQPGLEREDTAPQPVLEKEVTAAPGEEAADEEAMSAGAASATGTLHPDLLKGPSGLGPRDPLPPALEEEVCLDDIELQVDEPTQSQGPALESSAPASGLASEVRGQSRGPKVTSPRSRSKAHGSDSDRSLSASASARRLPQDRERPLAPVQELTLIMPGLAPEGGGPGGGRSEPTSPPRVKQATVAQQHHPVGEWMKQQTEDPASTAAAHRSTVSQITLDASNLLLPVPPCSPGRTGFAWQGVLAGHAHRRGTVEGSPGDGLPAWSPSREAAQGGGHQSSPKQPSHLSTITLEVPASEYGGTAESGGGEQHPSKAAQSRGPAKPAPEGGKARRRASTEEEELAVDPGREGSKARRRSAPESAEEAATPANAEPPSAAAVAEPHGGAAGAARHVLLDPAEFRPPLPSLPMREHSPRQTARTLHPTTSRKAEETGLPGLAIGPPPLKPPGHGGGDGAELSRSPRLLLQPLQHDGSKGPQYAIRRASYGLQQEQEKEPQEKSKAPAGMAPQAPTLLPQLSPPTAAQHLRMEFGGGREQIGLSSAQDALLERGRQLLQRGPRRKRFGVERSEPALDTLARVQQDLEMSHGSLSQAWVNMHSGASKDVLPCSLLVKGLLAAGVAQSDANTFVQLLLASAAASTAAAGSKGKAGAAALLGSPGAADFRSPRTTTTVSVVDFFAAFSPDGLPQRAVDAARVASCKVGIWEGRPSPPPISKSRTPRGGGA